MSDFIQETPPEGQVMCPLCWPNADPREFAFAPCADHGAARQAPAPDDERFREDAYYGNGGSDADAATCRAFQALISKKENR
jgi:hypothetical protein